MNRLDVKTAVVTGAAGFIGSTLVDALLAKGIQVKGVDNLSTGKKEFLNHAFKDEKFTFLITDIFSGESLEQFFSGADIVFHFAANADVRFGPDNPARDLEQNTIATQRVLEASRKARIRRIVFSSTGSVYGESNVVPTPENAPFPIQTSLYGASKLACEGLIQAYAEAFEMQAFIFRFVSILGPRYTHGHVFDFVQQLKNHPNSLRVLGDGRQRKSYLHVIDCIEAIFTVLGGIHEKVNIFNLGVNGICEVRDSVSWIVDSMGLKPEIAYGEGRRGWIGDNPLIHLDTTAISSLGWKPKYTIEEAVRDTVKFMKDNSWIFENPKQQ